MQPLVLVIDDEERYRTLYAETLRQAGFRVETAESADRAAELLRDLRPDMIVSDVRMPGTDGIAFLTRLSGERPGLPYLLITAYADIRDAVRALKLGAVDYLEKPVDLDELVSAVSDALHVAPARAADAVPLELVEGIVAESRAMQSLLADAYRVAQSDATVLITGESGVGKEVLAAFIHRCGNRSARPFLALNCAAIPATLLASELFGHERGAFTGAVTRRNGIFREADTGTLFLDEIGDMPLDLQPALLRAIETGRVLPLGSDRDVAVNVRLIAATNKDLAARVRTGQFREDLYYRLNVIALEVLPLRERRDDILPLARHFLARRKGTPKRLSPATAGILQAYPWPGNVRELANAMERAGILSSAEVILPEHLPTSIPWQPVGGAANLAPVAAGDAVRTMQELEDDAIRRALDQTNGNRTRAAELLGISRRALIYKLKRMGIK